MWPKHWHLPKPDPARQGLVWRLPELFHWVNHHMMTVAVIVVGIAVLKLAWQKGRRPLWNMIRSDCRAAWRAVFSKRRKRRDDRKQAGGLPARLDFIDDGGPIDMVPYGVGKDGKWLHADLTGTTPHVLISAPTGWGKTSFISIFVAWIAGRGGTVDICDPKRIGYLDTFSNIPNVRIRTSIETMTDAIMTFRDDMLERYRLREEQGANIEDREQYPVRLLVMDEMGSLIAMMKQYYDEIKERGDPKNPPWLSAIMMILWQGRYAGFHVITGAQQANAQVLINSDARDQYGLKIAAGPTSHNAWGMMFGPGTPTVNPGQGKGRAVAGVGPELQPVQLAVIDPEQARALALGGRPDPGPNGPVRGPYSPDTPFEPTDWGDDNDQDVDVIERSQDDPFLAADQADREESNRGRGRPPAAARSRVDVSCQCGHTWQSRARDGSWVKCPKCRTSCRVPDRDQAA